MPVHNIVHNRLLLIQLGLIYCMMTAAVYMSGCAPTATVRSADMLPVRCLDRPRRGHCRASIPAFYYDYRTDRCRQFLYSGCGGFIPFSTLNECATTCIERH